ncbi:hypothetical protein BGX26_002789 [Mortierella sp. AD094]|nr:hypothetical protein BGX26_002789 [Mortierella sp. AD094]
MDANSPYDDWSKHIHAVITFLKPYFNDWRGYVSLVSVVLGIGVLVMESQVLLRMRMGRWEILGYAIWCVVSCLIQITQFMENKNACGSGGEGGDALLPAPVAKNYRIMGGVCVAATVLTLASNILYMLRGWKEPSQFFDWSSEGVRWLTSQIWYAIGMIILFHVVTRPAQSGVVLFGKFPRDLWAYKWYLCILYVPVHYMLLELCDIHRDTKEILVPLEIIVDIVLYNGPFLVVLLRLMYWGWKVAYDEAVLTGAIFEDEDTEPGSLDGRPTGVQRRAATGSRSGGGDYVGLAMTDLDEAERGQGNGGHTGKPSSSSNKTNAVTEEPEGNVYVLEDEDDEDDEAQTHISALDNPSQSPAKSPLLAKNPIKKSVVFDMNTEEETENEDHEQQEHHSPGQGGRQDPEPLV